MTFDEEQVICSLIGNDIPTRPRALHCMANNCKLRMDLAARTRASMETRAISDHRGISWFGVNHKIADVSCPAHGNQRFVGKELLHMS